MVPEELKKDATKRAATSIQMYLDKINDQNGINGHPLKLVIVDDGGTVDSALLAIDEMSRENKAMIVLGNTYSDLAIAIGPSLAQYGIPAITSDATTPEVTFTMNGSSKQYNTGAVHCALRGRSA
jgi:ABC-type branched-subunit amino acid transport system substrate-binding protein